MTPELTALALALLWQGVQFALVSVPANRELGTEITLAPRDAGPLVDKVGPRTARIARALDNHAAALTLFAPAGLCLSRGARGLCPGLCVRLAAMAVHRLDGGLCRHHGARRGFPALTNGPMVPYAGPATRRRDR